MTNRSPVIVRRRVQMLKVMICAPFVLTFVIAAQT